MKKNFKLPLFVLFTSLLLLLSCNKRLILKITPTTFTLNTTHVISGSEESGYFFANGDPTVSGTYIMQIEVDGDSLHCDQTLSTTRGTIVIHSDCSMVDNKGIWFITGGTHAYWNLEGNGTLIMEFPKDAPSVEALTGITWRRSD